MLIHFMGMHDYRTMTRCGMQLRVMTCLFVVPWVLVACATPTISNDIYFLPIPTLNVSHGDAIHDGALIGGGGLDWVMGMDCAANGSFTLYGQTIKSFGESTDFLIVQTTSELSIRWARTYGGRHKDTLHRARQTLDQGHLLLGVSTSLFYTPLPGEKPQRPFIVKLDSEGDPQWSLLVNPGEKSLIGELVDFAQLRDGSFVFVGQSRFDTGHKYLWDIAAIKLDSQGNYIWGYRYRMGEDSKAGRVVLLDDDHILIAAQTQKGGSRSLVENEQLLLEINADGQPQWSKAYQAEKGGIYVRDIKRDGNRLLLTGLYYTGKNHTFAMQLAQNGSLDWASDYNNTQEESGGPLASTVLENGRYLIVGRAGEKRGQPIQGDYYRGEYGSALIIDGNGKVIYATYIGGDRDEEIRAVQSLPGEIVCIALNTESFGATYSDMLVARWKLDDIPSEASSLYVGRTLKLDIQDLAVDRSAMSIDIEQLPTTRLNAKSLTPVRELLK